MVFPVSQSTQLGVNRKQRETLQVNIGSAVAQW